MPLQIIDYQQALKALCYQASSGKFFWVVPPKNHPRLFGKEAGRNSSGYTVISFNKKKFKAHRLAWLFTHGFLPKQIDHINGDRADNRMSNLRECSNPQNQANKLKKKGKTEPKGVRRLPSGKYQARLTVDGGQLSLGVYESVDAASNAYIASSRHHYGEFARQSC